MVIWHLPAEGILDYLRLIEVDLNKYSLNYYFAWHVLKHSQLKASILPGLTFPSQQIVILTLQFETKTFLACNLETKPARAKRGSICDPSQPYFTLFASRGTDWSNEGMNETLEDHDL